MEARAIVSKVPPSDARRSGADSTQHEPAFEDHRVTEAGTGVSHRTVLGVAREALLEISPCAGRPQGEQSGNGAALWVHGGTVVPPLER